MLQELKVSQFAIIDSLHIEFQNGLNILSGETGSGKSVLLKSLGLLMGEKSSAEIIRTGCKTATVEGSFNLKKRPDLEKKLIELGIEVESHQLIVRRILSTEDRSKIYLNGVLSPLSLLRDLITPLIEVTGTNAPLIEMTGQHDNRNLLSKNYHLDLLDQFAQLWDKRSQYEHQFSIWTKLKFEILEFEKKSQEKSQRLDFLKFQINEYSNLNIQPETDNQLEQNIKSLKNSSKIINFAELCDQIIYQDDDSVSARLKTLIKKSAEFAHIDTTINEKILNLEQAQILIDDTIFSVCSYVQNIDNDPTKLEEKEARLSQIRKLQKKHGDDLNAMIEKFELMRIEILNLENSDQHLISLKNKSTHIENDLKKIAHELHLQRHLKSEKLSQKVNSELKDLNMKGVLFDIQIEKTSTLTSTGITDLEFLSQTSPKDPKRPIAKVSSGGELSRLLLALKKSVGSTSAEGTTSTPRTYLFDEVDSGISGPTAEKVGRKLKEIAKGQQVICVTHLPQVAACGDVHFSIQKSTSGGQALMTVQELSHKDRVDEIARLISGEKISKTSIAHAEQLLEEIHILN